MSKDLTEREAGGMTVNERLWVSGLMESFDEAVTANDEAKMRSILKKVYLSSDSIEAILARVRP